MKTDLLDIRLADCMNLMREFPDKQFDLAIVDPPYGIGAASANFQSRGKLAKPTEYDSKDWDKEIPTKEYFDEVMRVSKNQIIWGGNYFSLPPSPGWIVWHKKDAATDFSDCELAWTSIGVAVRYFRFLWAGMWQGDMGNKEKRIHPTQKPVALYKWLLSNYAKPGQRILDTHLGSGSHAIACHYFGAHLTASELDPDYYTAACERIERETRQTDMFSQTPSLIHTQSDFLTTDSP